MASPISSDAHYAAANLASARMISVFCRHSFVHASFLYFGSRVVELSCNLFLYEMAESLPFLLGLDLGDVKIYKFLCTSCTNCSCLITVFFLICTRSSEL